MTRRIPAAAQADLVEWGPHHDALEQVRAVVGFELPAAKLPGAGATTRAIEDDRPLNEYDWLRTDGLRLFPFLSRFRSY
jgi:hypothetical protein